VPVNAKRKLTPKDWLRLTQQPGGIHLSDVLGEQAAEVRIVISVKGAVQESHRFPIASEFSSLDVGDILVRRFPRVHVRVLGHAGGDWRPVRAGVASSQDAAKTGADGRAVLAYRPGDRLQVLAVGYDFSQVPVPEDPGSDELVIRLETAPALEVVVPERLLDPSGRHQPQVKVAFNSSPFGSWNHPDRPAVKMTHRLYEACVSPFSSGLSKLQGHFMLVPVPASGLARIAGLRKGVALDVSLTDYQNEEYATRSIVLDQPLRLEDWPAELQPAFLDARILDPTGTSGASGRYGLRANSFGTIYLAFEAGRFRAGPLTPGVYVLTLYIQVGSGYSTPREFEGIELLGGSNSLTVDLASGEIVLGR